MNCKRAKELFADALVGNLNHNVRNDLEAHLRSCASCREETTGLGVMWEKLATLPGKPPSAALDQRVQATIDAYRDGMQHAEREMRRKWPTFAAWMGSLLPKHPAFQFALAVLFFALGLLAGAEIVRMRYTATTASSQLSVGQLREEIARMKQLLTLSLLQQPSASERLRGVEWTAGMEQPDEQILSALLRVLDLDPNVNVRLAAVEVLQRFVQDLRAREGLINALSHSQPPLVQIDLIDALVQANEKKSITVLKALLRDADIDASVRERAKWALQKLT